MSVGGKHDWVYTWKRDPVTKEMEMTFIWPETTPDKHIAGLMEHAIGQVRRQPYNAGSKVGPPLGYLESATKEKK